MEIGLVKELFMSRQLGYSLQRFAAVVFAFMIGTHFVCGEDWSRFRGENGSGISNTVAALPTEFSADKNLKWKVPLPGPGSSSPIVVGDRVFVTCWTGYGTPKEPDGKIADLKRHLLCYDRNTGKQIWDRSVAARLPEDVYEGMFAEHGYASHTPVSDGKSVFAFFGKSGVYAYDLDGNEKWHALVGDGLDNRRWGSSSSPVLFEDLVIVLAAAESQTIYAFDKETGKEVWKEKADGFSSTWGTPIIVQTASGESELVVGVPFEVWAFHPKTGKFKWFCAIPDTDSYCSSVVADKDIVYSLEGRGGGGVAIRAGGKEDVSASHVLWKGSLRNRIGSPVIHDGLMYFVNSKVVQCVDANTGSSVYEGRLPSASAPASNRPRPGAGPGGQPQGGPPQGGGPGRGQRGGGGMGGQDYSSLVAADGKLYYVTRNGDIHVMKLGRQFQHLGVNRVTSDNEDFSATPAIAGNQIFVRSSHHLYCISGE